MILAGRVRVDGEPRTKPGQNVRAGAEVISLDGMRSSAPSYQTEDLDVPAFLRKRSEVM